MRKSDDKVQRVKTNEKEREKSEFLGVFANKEVVHQVLHEIGRRRSESR
jgi:hypothetical protein